MSKPRNRVARRKVMLPRTGRNVVIARQVNPPSCVVVSKEVISRVMVDSVIVRPIPRLHVRGRDCGRDIRAIGTVPITELEKGGNETENILFRNLFCAGPARIFFFLFTSGDPSFALFTSGLRREQSVPSRGIRPLLYTFT